MANKIKTYKFFIAIKLAVHSTSHLFRKSNQKNKISIKPETTTEQQN